MILNSDSMTDHYVSECSYCHLKGPLYRSYIIIYDIGLSNVHDKSTIKETDCDRDQAVPHDQQVKQDCVEQAQAGRAGDNHDHSHRGDADHKDYGDHKDGHDHKDDRDIVEDESSHGGGCENEDEDVVSKD